MSTKIKLATELGGHNIGDTIEVTAKAAEYLRDNGHVTDTRTKTASKDTSNEE